ncbi:hypothetical protein [Metallosphaera hakonensis]|uniref:Uncharacterized protein n=1 Tax=Metallosphaera hakonensis JCM 8857 = DSM 7519 TaxID=1293036 RepID=A0A2U9ITJ2_9CREN|nr:hypothetical protein [Metallosphaera hakonensis]AWR99369.1 hypothetical protein DFR87_06240 [Metallosphaera hakonensis JCM 8857 = DSM 7519]
MRRAVFLGILVGVLVLAGALLNVNYLLPSRASTGTFLTVYNGSALVLRESESLGNITVYMRVVNESGPNASVFAVARWTNGSLMFYGDVYPVLLRFLDNISEYQPGMTFHYVVLNISGVPVYQGTDEFLLSWIGSSESDHLVYYISINKCVHAPDPALEVIFAIINVTFNQLGFRGNVVQHVVHYPGVGIVADSAVQLCFNGTSPFHNVSVNDPVPSHDVFLEGALPLIVLSAISLTSLALTLYFSPYRKTLSRLFRFRK